MAEEYYRREQLFFPTAVDYAAERVMQQNVTSQTDVVN
jgi:hypothetical protein